MHTLENQLFHDSRKAKYREPDVYKRQIYGKVENSVIFPGVVVEEGACVKDSIVMQETHIGRGTRILRAIVDEEVRVGENCVIGGEGAIAVIGCRVQVGNDVVVDAGRAVSPGETLA